ncbi:MAG: methylmalonyl-CoA mutase family protein [Bacteroidales bacterium]|nr:methylmalonyl-CoA mutase family protein [Bacteroidales bacterium]MDD4384416.1 methylmalonyl-CoA mutase family protein [Bacteroidales bacterium]MDY0196593.1 methylmalonyl-CoA mutase family protein [Tenuifilaceae bacterium]
MAENKNDSKLFSEFPPVSTEAWEALIKKDLKGADYDKKLVWKTMEGFSVKPYYRAEDLKSIKSTQALPGEFPYARGVNANSNSWLVRQDFDACDGQDANAKALDALKRGADSVGFVTCASCEPSIEGVSKLIAGIDATNHEVNFVSGCNSRKILPVLIEAFKKAKVDIAKAKGSFDYSPLTAFSLNGKFCVDQETAAQRTLEVFNSGQALSNFKLIAVRGDIFRNAGSSVTQELAFALAMGVEYVNWLTEKGVSVDDAFSKIFFTLGVGSSYFMEIAKFRAIRLLWAKVAEAYACKNCKPITVHATNTIWNKTVYDPYINMLRTTTETMSAALGGVHSFTVLPFDAPYQKQTAFSERIARNQQIVVKEEAYFDKVVDPAAGSYYIETLTQSVINHAWDLFIKVQDLGGYVKAFTAGFIQNDINTVAAKRDSSIATRRQTVLGTNQYPNFTEVADKKVVTIDAVTKHEAKKSADAICEPLIQYRGSQALEELRYKTDVSGKRPKAFMLAIGSLAFRRARAQFSCNFFACAGFEVVDNIGFKTIDEGLKAALAAKSDIVVICSSDDEYETLAPEAFDKLKGDAVFVVAGDPACKPVLEAKGIKNFISVKSNLLETLREYQRLLKI